MNKATEPRPRCAVNSYQMVKTRCRHNSAGIRNFLFRIHQMGYYLA